MPLNGLSVCCNLLVLLIIWAGSFFLIRSSVYNTSFKENSLRNSGPFRYLEFDVKSLHLITREQSSATFNFHSIKCQSAILELLRISFTR